MYFIPRSVSDMTIKEPSPKNLDLSQARQHIALEVPWILLFCLQLVTGPKCCAQNATPGHSTVCFEPMVEHLRVQGGLNCVMVTLLH